MSCQIRQNPSKYYHVTCQNRFRGWQVCVLSGLPPAAVVTFKASSKVNLLNDDTYRSDCATVIMSYFRQIEQGVH